ncbi:unnamed protein product [Leptosia nina]|uniref:Ribosomal protein S10 n=1 Tax=Leptosia nina TaxID=320188 RepID=A0AAV1JWZ2_9NEOP
MSQRQPSRARPTRRPNLTSVIPSSRIGLNLICFRLPEGIARPFRKDKIAYHKALLVTPDSLLADKKETAFLKLVTRSGILERGIARATSLGFGCASFVGQVRVHLLLSPDLKALPIRVLYRAYTVHHYTLAEENHITHFLERSPSTDRVARHLIVLQPSAEGKVKDFEVKRAKLIGPSRGYR